MNNQMMKAGAAVCCVAYILSVLFLPVMSLFHVGASGIRLISFSGWCYLPIVLGLIMGACALMLPGKAGAIVSFIGAWFPLITFFLVRSDLVSIGPSILSGIGLDSAGTAGMYLVSSLIQVGFGVILSMLFGFGSAVLCYLSDYQSKPKTHSAGLTSDGGDEW